MPSAFWRRKKEGERGRSNHFLWNTPASRPPPEGGRAVYGDSPGYSARGEELDFSRVFTLTAEKGSSPRGTVSMGNRPVGEGLTGRGGRRRRLPPLLSWRVTENLSRWISPTTRPLPRPPPPSRGGGQYVAIVRIPCQGRGFQQGVHVDGRERIFSPWHCIYVESPPWGRG